VDKEVVQQPIFGRATERGVALILGLCLLGLLTWLVFLLPFIGPANPVTQLVWVANSQSR
jgi:hypothetical protein